MWFFCCVAVAFFLQLYLHGRVLIGTKLGVLLSDLKPISVAVEIQNVMKTKKFPSCFLSQSAIFSLRQCSFNPNKKFWESLMWVYGKLIVLVILRRYNWGNRIIQNCKKVCAKLLILYCRVNKSCPRFNARE